MIQRLVARSLVRSLVRSCRQLPKTRTVLSHVRQYSELADNVHSQSVLTPRWDAIRSARPFSEFLTDTFGREHDYLRISISERCNLRCIYCMPEEGVELSPASRLLTKDEIVAVARLFVSQGVTKIRLTGGEPSVRKDFLDIVAELGKIPGLREIAITTNGITLSRKLAALKSHGLTAINISLDTMVEGKYMIMTRRNGLSKVLATIDEALRTGIPKVKINVVVMRSINDDEILDFVRLTESKPIEVRFIEYMPFAGNKWSTEKLFSYEEMRSVIKEAHPTLRRVPVARGDTAKVFEIPGHAGRIGFITSVTSHFCGSCNRLRITSDGNLKVCLFGNDEVSIRDMLRRGAPESELLSVIGTAVKGKKEKHAGIGELEKLKNRPMILIGGSVLRTVVPSVLTLDDEVQKNVSAAYTFGSLVAPLSIGRPRPFQARLFSTSRQASQLTHVDKDGSAHMVDVSSKKHTRRSATARGVLTFSHDGVVPLIEANTMKKGDVLGVARVAGIMAVKSTPNLIPLCHPIMVSKIKNDLTVGSRSVQVECTVECVGPTGVEMEAMVGAMASLTTVYDMCKASDRHMVIDQVHVVRKTGGSHDFDLAG